MEMGYDFIQNRMMQSMHENIFSTQEQRTIGEVGNLIIANIYDIVDFKNHTFDVEEDADMEELRDSIRENGLDHPGTAFYNEQGELELISGHRRKHILMGLGKTEMPILVKHIDRNTAVRIMVESNLKNRKNIKPSVLAKSYNALLESLKIAGKQKKFVDAIADEESIYKGDKKRYRTKDEIEKMLNKSYSSINQYIRLLSLDERLLCLVDQGKMGIKPAVDISHFDAGIQNAIWEYYDENEVTPSHAQTIRMKKLYKDSLLDELEIKSILSESKPNQMEGIKISEDIINRYLNNCPDKASMENRIIKALMLLEKQEKINGRTRENANYEIER